MTRIAIVEDEEKYYHILKEYIQKYAGENSEEIEVVWVSKRSRIFREVSL